MERSRRKIDLTLGGPWRKPLPQTNRRDPMSPGKGKISYVVSAGFPTCCIADFQSAAVSTISRSENVRQIRRPGSTAIQQVGKPAPTSVGGSAAHNLFEKTQPLANSSQLGITLRTGLRENMGRTSSAPCSPCLGIILGVFKSG